MVDGEIAGSAWEYIRRPDNGNTPFQAVNRTDMRCNSGASLGRELGTSTQANTSWQEPECLVWAIRRKNSFSSRCWLRRRRGSTCFEPRESLCTPRISLVVSSASFHFPLPSVRGWGLFVNVTGIL